MLLDATGSRLYEHAAIRQWGSGRDHASGRFCDGLLHAGGVPLGADALKPDVTTDFIMVHRTMWELGKGHPLRCGDVRSPGRDGR